MRCDAIFSLRSLRFGKPIPMKEYIDSFLNSPDGPKGAVKELTKEIRDQMIAMTVDAPDWCVRNPAARRQPSRAMSAEPTDLGTSGIRSVRQRRQDSFCGAMMTGYRSRTSAPCRRGVYKSAPFVLNTPQP